MAVGHYVHFITIALSTAINAIGVGIGQGITGAAAIQAINRQPAAHDKIKRAAILGIALIETAAVVGIFVSILLILQSQHHVLSVYGSIAELGIAFSMCFSGFAIGIASSLPARAACLATARQPFFHQQIVRFMLISLSLLQTPIIFGLVIALFIQNQAYAIDTIRDALRLIAGGLCIGLGSIGPVIGLACFSQKACEGMGINRNAYGHIFAFTLISQAIIETPIIFALIISLALLFLVPSMPHENIIDGIALFSAGLCTGLGTIGPGISSGRTATAACQQITSRPESYGMLSRTSMFAQGLIETSAIYCVLVSFLLLFFR